MKKYIIALLTLFFITGCNASKVKRNDIKVFDKNSKVVDVINNKSFKDYGRLIFPVDRSISQNKTLNNIDDIYVWYNYINVNKTVEIVNYMKQNADSGNQIFYNIYSEKERKENSELNNTGLFFFKGKDNAKTAIVNAGGGFMYVGAMHDSFPHALELSKKGYNAFALIYRPDTNKALQDLSRAVSYLHKNQKKLKIDMQNYSVWGGSAGARMAAWLGNHESNDYNKPSAVIMQYTGYSQVTGNEPPTYANVGTSDSIASYMVMRERINKIKENGTDAQIEIFEGLPHGYGIGDNTVASGWINNTIKFWERNCN